MRFSRNALINTRFPKLKAVFRQLPDVRNESDRRAFSGTKNAVYKVKSMNGKVKMFNTGRGFGFITGEDGKDVYVHATAVEGGAQLAPGDSVEYEVEDSQRGPRAKDVKKV